ncbi:MAG: hypothetical protein WA210_02985 [Burkholderiaceae bacterium]
MKPIERLTDTEFCRLAGRASRLADAPQGWVDAALALWKVTPRVAANGAKPKLLTRIAAALSFDSWATPALALGMRSMALDNRHLLYSARGRDIDVRINLAADRFAVTGQILGPDEFGEVELASQGDAPGSATPRTARLDTLGEFRFDAVDRGAYLLTLRVGNDEIVLPPIVIGERLR